MPEADRLIALFTQAQLRAAEADREQFLAEACPNEPGLREQVRSLLRASNREDGIIQKVFDADHAPDTTVTGDVIGGYKQRETLGEGGCGVVYVAEQEKPVRRLVALKIIKSGMDTRSVVARFEAERQALALMDHPNIAKVFEAGSTDSGRPYFVMELVRGVRVTQYCEQNQLSITERLHLFIQVCQAIQHAHQKGIIHRDIKPSNILVTLQDGTPVPKVIDFGIAKATEGRLADATVYTQLHHFIGTPAYMSPEQAEMSDQGIDTRADIYSLGVVLYELLVGATPFDAKDLLSRGLDGMRRTIREQEPLRPSTKLKQTQCAQRGGRAPSTSHQPKTKIDADLDWIVMKCLEKDRQRRYETANGLAADLRRYLDSEPVAARPPSTWYRLQKTLRRHRIAFAAGSAVALSLVIAVFASLRQMAEITHAQREKLEEVSRAQRETDRQSYVSKMRLARQAWEDGDPARLRRLLEETATFPDRGFEWYYWQRQTHLELKTLRGHLEPVVDVSFSADGGRVLTASLDGTARIWDTLEGSPLRTLEGHSNGVTSASWSPNGGRIVTASADLTAAVWDAASGHRLFQLWGHTNQLTAARFSPDGKHILTASLDGTARLWQAENGLEVRPLSHRAPVLSAAFMPDGKRILTGTSDREVVVWDATTGASNLSIATSVARPEFPVFPVFSAGISPDGSSIVTVGQDQTACLWDAGSGAQLFPLQASTFMISPRQIGLPLAASFSPDSKRLVVGGLDFTATVWGLANRTPLFTLKGHEAEVVSVAFSPDGTRIVTGSYDSTAKIWDGTASTESVSLVGQKPVIVSSAFSPDGGRVVTSSWDGTAVVWDAVTGSRVFALEHRDAEGGSDQVWCVGFSPDGTRIVTGTLHGRIHVWDALAGRERHSFDGHGPADVITVEFSADGNRILSGGGDATAKVWDAFTGRTLVEVPHNQRFVYASFAPGSQRAVSVCNDNDRHTPEDATAVIWDTETGRELLPLKGHTNGFSGVAWSPDGRYIVTGCVDYTATVWHALTGIRLRTLMGHVGQVRHIAISPDSRRIFTGGFENTTRVWDAESGDELLTLKGGVLCSPGLSRDGRRLVLGAYRPATVLQAASPDQCERWREEERRAAAKIEEERHGLRRDRTRDRTP